MYDNDKLNRIYDRTDGNCHVCGKKLAFTNHGKHGSKGAWHVEHSIPRAKGGSSRLNNLYAACIPCNLSKGTRHTKTARGWYGNTRAPYSANKKKQIQNDNTIGGAILGGILGSMFGPRGAVLGATIGGAIGNSNSPKK